MPMSTAERMKNYRERLKLDPEKYEEKKKKHREYMRSVRPSVNELPKSEQVKLKRQWNAANKKKREKKLNGVQKCDKKIEDRKKYRDLLKKIHHLEEVAETLTRKNNRLKKQNYRQKVKIANLVDLMAQKNETDIATQNRTPNPKLPVQIISSADVTPLTKTDIFIRNNMPKVSESEKERVKKKILQLNVLTKSLFDEYNKAEDNKARVILKNIVNNDVTKKYKLKTSLTKNLGLKGQIRKWKKKAYDYKESNKIRNFFIRDDISRMTAGKKETVTKGKVKQQKRFLLQTLKRLYSKYVAEGGKASYSTFRRNKPFYVVRPKVTDRDTCVCVRHSNLSFKAQKLKKLGVIETHDLDSLVRTVACDIKSYDCMYSKCAFCKFKNPPLNTESTDVNEQCSWLQWQCKEHEYTKQNEDGTKQLNKTKKYEKAVKDCTISELISLFIAELVSFKKHFYNVQYQHAKYREVVNNLFENEACILIDFSENYQCKLSQEIQSLHFGASRIQITLHTGIIYKKDHDPKCFVSVSPNNDHNPGAIWAHLEPVIDYLKKMFPGVNVLHFFSDGPTTQYRQKKNFYQMRKLLEENGFLYGTWSFFEAAHGKGAADGVGAAVKRTLDQAVAYGQDIVDAENAVNILKYQTNMEIFYVPDSKIKEKQRIIPEDLIPIPGTMQIHQIISYENKLKYRDVSCFCGTLRGICDCFNVKTHDLVRSLLKERIQQKPDITRKRRNNLTKQTSNQKQPDKLCKRKGRNKKKHTNDHETETNTDSSNISFAESDDSPYYIDEILTDNDDILYDDPTQIKEAVKDSINFANPTPGTVKDDLSDYKKGVTLGNDEISKTGAIKDGQSDDKTDGMLIGDVEISKTGTVNFNLDDVMIVKAECKEKKNKKAECNKRIRKEKKRKKSTQVTNCNRRVVNRSDTSESDEEMTEKVVQCRNDHETHLNADKENMEGKYHDSNVVRKDFEVGDFVIFVYEEEYFVGRIESSCLEGALIKSMQKSLKSWKWPVKDDLNLYNLSDIKEKIEDPQIINTKRGLYYVREFGKYRDFI